MLTDEQVRAKNIETSRRAAQRLANASWHPREAREGSKLRWADAPDLTLDITHLTAPYVVYVLRNSGSEVIYVGQTTGFYKRLGEHLQDLRKRGARTAELYYCYSLEEARDLERHMIRYFTPRLNVQGVKGS